MSRDVELLKEPFRTGIKLLLAKAKAAGLPVLVTDTTRTIEEQRENVRKGYSKTMDSKHLTGEACDIAFTVNGKLSYDQNLYWKLYEIVKTVPHVIWPYVDLNWKWDWPHHQYDKNKKVVDNIGMDYKSLYEQEKKDHAETIKAKDLNYTKWQEELDRRKALEQNSVTRVEFETMERKLNTEIGKATKERDDAVIIRDNALRIIANVKKALE